MEGGECNEFVGIAGCSVLYGLGVISVHVGYANIENNFIIDMIRGVANAQIRLPLGVRFSLLFHGNNTAEHTFLDGSPTHSIAHGDASKMMMISQFLRSNSKR